MAFLMLLHEKLRLQRTINKLTLRQLKASSRKEKVAKQIERIQKMYSKQISSLESTSKEAMSRFKSQLTGGLSYGLNGIGNLIGGISGGIGAMLGGASKDIISALKEKYPDAKYATAIAAMAAGGCPDLSTTEGKTIQQEYIMLASQQQSQITQICSLYEQNASIWLEAEKAALEEAQDAALAPLEEKETEWDLENQVCETQLADARARLDSISEALKDGVKNSAPTFGLG